VGAPSAIAQLESTSDPAIDPFARARLDKLDLVFVDGDTETHKSWKLEKVLDKKVSPTGIVRYLVKWKGYGSEENQWISLKNMGDALDLIADYEKSAPKTIKPTRKLAFQRVSSND
jgi:hypothetical protein